MFLAFFRAFDPGKKNTKTNSPSDVSRVQFDFPMSSQVQSGKTCFLLCHAKDTLLEGKAEANTRGRFGYTALMVAATWTWDFLMANFEQSDLDVKFWGFHKNKGIPLGFFQTTVGW